MSKETCTIKPCPHGQGFNCPTCWPTKRGNCPSHGRVRVPVGWDFCGYCGRTLTI